MKATEGTIDWNIEKKYIGYMPQTCQFNGSMKVRDAIKFFAEIKQADMNESMEILRKMKLDETKKMISLIQRELRRIIGIKYILIWLAMSGMGIFFFSVTGGAGEYM